MTTEHEIERMVVRLIGDGVSYQKMLKDAEVSTAKTAGVIGGLLKGIEKIKDTLNSVGQGISRFGQGMIGVGTKMSLAITAPITALAGVATNEFNQFESALSRMKGLVGLNDEEIQGFKEHILELAVATGKAPTELAQAMENITSSGVQGNAALETLDISARAAAGGLGEVRSVSDTVTSAMNAYGVANLSATKATDILVAAVREGKAEAETFAPVLGNVLPIANEMGISFDEAAGSIAYLTLATGSASTAATQYQNILAQSLKLNEKHDSGKILTGAGISIKQFQKDIADKGLQPTLMALKDSLAKVGLTLKDAFPDVQAMTAALQLTGANSSKAASVLENVSRAAGSVDTAFGAAAETTKFKLNQSMAEMKVILIELGELIAPVFAKFTTGLGSLMQYWKGLDNNSKQWVVTILAAVAAIGPLLIGLGTFLTIIGGAVSGVATLIGVFTSLLSPIGLVLAAVVSLGVYLLTSTDLWGQAVQWFGEQWTSLLDYVRPAIEGITMAVRDGNLELAFQIAWAQIKLTFAEGIQPLRQMWNDFTRDFIAIWRQVVIAFAIGSSEIERDAKILFIRLTKAARGIGQGEDPQIKAIKEAHDLHVKFLKQDRDEAIDNVVEKNRIDLKGMKDNIESLKRERNLLIREASKGPMLHKIVSVTSGIKPTDPVIKETEDTIDDLRKKGQIDLSLKFDAAASGSAEALSRLNDYQALVGREYKAPKTIDPWVALEQHVAMQNQQEMVVKSNFHNTPTDEQHETQQAQIKIETLLLRIAQAVEGEATGSIIELAEFKR